MPSTQITNPRAAFGVSNSLNRTVDTFQAANAIGRRQAVIWSGATGRIVAKAGVSAAPAAFAGIALEAAAAGDDVQVVTRGLVDDVPIDGAAPALSLLKPGTTAGSLIVAGTPAVGDVGAVAISAAAGGKAVVKVL